MKRASVLPPVQPAPDEPTPIYDQAVRVLGIDPAVLLAEAAGLIANQRSLFERVYPKGRAK